MKKTIIILSLILLTGFCIGQNRSINFDTASFAELKAKARKANKLIFIDAYTVWCGPCKWMAKNVFTNDTVADYFNSKFINAKIDMEKEKGIEIKKLYEVSCYPTYLFLDGNGKLIHRDAGSRPAKSFILVAEDAQNPDKRFSRFSEEYESKKSDPNFLLQYLAALSETCMKAGHVLDDYFTTQPDKELSSRANWYIIRDYNENIDSREFQYLLSHVQEYYDKYTVDSVNTMIRYVFWVGGNAIINKKGANEDEFIAYKETISKNNFPFVNELLFKLDKAYLVNNQEWAKYVAYVIENTDKYVQSVNELNDISWTIYEHSDDPAALLKAESWMKKVIQDEKDGQDWAFYDTYAAVLYKLKKKQEAKAMAIKAIELAKASGTAEKEYQTTIDLLKKIEML
jgi:thiol-disulfide isomerase/thioredoxin